MDSEPAPETRSRGERIVRNTAVLTAAGLVTKVALLVFTIFAANVLGTGPFGDYAFLIAAISVAIVLADLGVENYSERELARNPSRLPSWLPVLVSLRVAGCLLVGGALALVLAFSDVGARVPAFIVLGPLLLLAMAVFQMLRAALRSTERLGYEAALLSGERFSFMLLATVFLLLGFGLTGFVGAQVLGTILAMGAATVLIARRVGRGKWRSPQAPVRTAVETLRGAIPFGLSAVCVIILFREDTIMLRLLYGADETGRYGVAFRVMEGFFLFPQMVALAMYPTFSIAFHGGDGLARLYHPLLRGLAVLGAGGAVLGILVAEPLISLLKPEFREAVDILVILLLAVPLVYGNYLVGTTLRAADRQVQNLIASAIAMVVNLVANLVLIPGLGGKGAALATLLTQILYFAIMSAQAWRLVGGTVICWTIVRVAIAGGGAWWVATLPKAWSIQVAVFVIVFCILSLALRAARLSDIRFILSAVRPQGSREKPETLP
jgi:O-antigen/teichoic acid export membrane protein